MSEHFTLAEFLHSDTAVARRIENLPTWGDIERLKRLAGTLEKIRLLLGRRPIVVSSGYRCHELNYCVGGAASSAHLLGYAADFTCPGFGTPTEICAHLRPHMVELQIDQLIDETGWVHVGLCDGPPRCQFFRL